MALVHVEAIQISKWQETFWCMSQRKGGWCWQMVCTVTMANISSHLLEGITSTNKTPPFKEPPIQSPSVYNNKILIVHATINDSRLFVGISSMGTSLTQENSVQEI